MNFFDYMKSLFAKKPNSTDLETAKKEVIEMTTAPKPEAEKLPEGVKYDRIEYDAPTDEEIAAAAEKELAAYKAQGEQKVDGDIAAEREKLEKNKATGEAQLAADQAAIDDNYDIANKKVSDDVLKRGLARSSIAVNRMADLSEARAAEKNNAATAANARLAEITSELNSLDFKREQALNSFNISLAAKLTERINELKDERNDREIEALKYNNSLTEKEQKYAADKVIQDSKLYSDALSQREKEDKYSEGYGKDAATQRAAYDRMRTALAGMSADAAKNTLRTDPFFEQNLSTYYYYKLYDEFGR